MQSEPPPIQPLSPYPRQQPLALGSLEQFNDLLRTHRRLGNAFALSILAFLIAGIFLMNFERSGSAVVTTLLTVCALVPAMFIFGWSGWGFAKTMGSNPIIGGVCGFLSPLIPCASLIGTVIAQTVITSKMKSIYGLKYRTLFGFRKREIEAVRLVLEQQATQHNH